MSDYDSVVQLGARIGAKIRDRDEQERGSLQRNKVSWRAIILHIFVITELHTVIKLIKV